MATVEELRKQVELLTSDPGARADLVANDVNGSVATAFVVMPFGPEDLQVVYNDYIKPTIEHRCSLKCVRGDDMFGSEAVVDDIVSAISNSEVVVADLTGQNANVFYEVGIAHAINKPVLLLAQSKKDIPFDLSHRRVLIYDYSPHGCKSLEGLLGDHVLDMRRRDRKNMNR